jgi:pimeloyl-ACP methyl ester carboxylesterase
LYYFERLKAVHAPNTAGIIIGGISMGAASTLHLAVHRPEIVRGLILVRPAWIAASAPANNSPNAQVGRLLMDLSQEDARKAFEVSETARRLAEIAPDNLASLRGFFSREPQATTAALLQAIAGDGPGVSEENLRNLDTPTLIIGQEIDYIHPLSYADTLWQLIPVPGLSRLHRKREQGRLSGRLSQGNYQFLGDFL